MLLLLHVNLQEKKNKIEELLTCFKGIDPGFVG